jgi:CBS domain-containing protein
MLLEIQNVHVLSGGGQTVEIRRVRCPVHAGTVRFERCLCCPVSGGVARDAAGRIEYASCRHDRASAEAGREAGLADGTPVSAVMTTDVLAVTEDVSLEALTRVLLERGISGAPVVDDEGRPVGVVSRTDLLDQRFVSTATGDASGEETGGGGRPGAVQERVSDAMTRAATALPEAAPAEEAAAIMVRHGIHRVLVVSDDGRLSGIVTGSDIMRWIARRARDVAARAALTAREACASGPHVEPAAP